MCDISFEVGFSKASAHIFQVKMRLTAPDPKGQLLRMAAWIPGSYMIREFAKNIISIRASSDAHTLQLEKIDKQTWRCPPSSAPIVVEYEVYAWDLSVRSAHLDLTHAYFNGTSLFFKVLGQEGMPCEVTILENDQATQQNWRVATTLPSFSVNESGFGLYAAKDYWELIDNPVEVGNLAGCFFNAMGVSHEVVIYGKQRTDFERLAADLSAICEEHAALFGELPVARYLFMIMALGDAYGGLEHRNCTSLICSRSDLPLPGELVRAKSYRGFLGLCSHEYFHLWNVTRIVPLRLRESVLEQEAYTSLLWVFEGFTSYYDDLALVRSGCISIEEYLEALAQTISRVTRTPGRFKQSVAESSFDTWTKFYRQDDNAPNAIVSYYAKGALIALALDIKLRTESARACSLDTVMRALWERYGRGEIGVGERDVELLIEEISGLELREFFSSVVYGTADPPLRELLAKVGIALSLRAASDASDMGGYVKELTPEASRRSLGLKLADQAEALVKFVFEGGAAQAAGIAPGDVIVAVDGLKVDASNLNTTVLRSVVDGPLRVHFFRRDELFCVEVKPQAAPEDTCELMLIAEADEAALTTRRQWLDTNRMMPNGFTA